MVKTKLTVFCLLAFGLSPTSQSETRTAIGEEAELIMKYGAISHTECGKLDEMQWKFCTSMVKLKENIDRIQTSAGIWECTFHHNYAGYYVNISCRRTSIED